MAYQSAMDTDPINNWDRESPSLYQHSRTPTPNTPRRRRSSSVRPVLRKIRNSIVPTTKRSNPPISMPDYKHLIEPRSGQSTPFGFRSPTPHYQSISVLEQYFPGQDSCVEPLSRRRGPNALGSLALDRRSVSSPCGETTPWTDGKQSKPSNNRLSIFSQVTNQSASVAPVRRSGSHYTKTHSRDSSNTEILGPESLQYIRILGSAKPSPITSVPSSLDLEEIDQKLRVSSAPNNCSGYAGAWSSNDSASTRSEAVSTCQSPSTFYTPAESLSRATTEEQARTMTDYEAFLHYSKYDVEAQQAFQESRPLTPLGYRVPVDGPALPSQPQLQTQSRGRTPSFISSIGQWLTLPSTHSGADSANVPLTLQTPNQAAGPPSIAIPAPTSTAAEVRGRPHRSSSRASSVARSIRNILLPKLNSSSSNHGMGNTTDNSSNNFGTSSSSVHVDESPTSATGPAEPAAAGTSSKRSSMMRTMFRRQGSFRGAEAADGAAADGEARQGAAKRRRREMPGSAALARFNRGVDEGAFR